MKFAIGLIFGALIGSAVALMFAPRSGEDLRADIKSQVDDQSARVQEQWQQKFQRMQKRIDSMSGEIQAIEDQSLEVELPA